MQAEQDRQSASARTPLILCYHAITAEPAPLSDFCFLPLSHFRAQMRFLSLVGANVIEFDEALERMRDKSLPRRTVVVTFDDGFKNNIDLALPILSRFRMPATVFLNTAFTGTSHGIWASRLTPARGCAPIHHL